MCAHSGWPHCQNCGAFLAESMAQVAEQTDRVANHGQAVILRLELELQKLSETVAQLTARVDRQREALENQAQTLLLVHGDRGAVHLDCFDDVEAAASRIRKAAKR